MKFTVNSEQLLKQLLTLAKSFSQTTSTMPVIDCFNFTLMTGFSIARGMPRTNTYLYLGNTNQS